MTDSPATPETDAPEPGFDRPARMGIYLGTDDPRLGVIMPRRQFADLVRILSRHIEYRTQELARPDRQAKTAKIVARGGANVDQIKLDEHRELLAIMHSVLDMPLPPPEQEGDKNDEPTPESDCVDGRG
jgi:hypothetical protein